MTLLEWLSSSSSRPANKSSNESIMGEWPGRDTLPLLKLLSKFTAES